MKRALLAVVLLGLGAAAAVALTRWPLINDVETGRTPEYPDLKPRDYRQGEAAVGQAAKAVVGQLPRWTLVGAGSGPGGAEIQAVAAAPLRIPKQDVTIRIRRQGGATRVTVRSRSRLGWIDFGQNARNIRAFFEALEKQLGAAAQR